jgi:hypothetical protein
VCALKIAISIGESKRLSKGWIVCTRGRRGPVLNSSCLEVGSTKNGERHKKRMEEGEYGGSIM